MKTCTKCDTEKSLSCFYFKNKETGRRASVCIDCHKKLVQKHYVENKEYYVYKSKKYKEKYREQFKAYKETLSCQRCGEDRAVTLDFHHAEGKKESNISDMVRTQTRMTTLVKEIKKCIVLCANCHRIVHEEEDTPS